MCCATIKHKIQHWEICGWRGEEICKGGNAHMCARLFWLIQIGGTQIGASRIKALGEFPLTVEYRCLVFNCKASSNYLLWKQILR